jgi:RNA polymerase sigma-70 factor (ECF subfamily)
MGRRNVLSKGRLMPNNGEGPDDDSLLGKVGCGDVAAFESLYDRYSRSVYSVVFEIIGETGGASEVAQEVFLAIWQQASRFDSTRGRARSWILAVAHHKAVDALRSRKCRPTLPMGAEPAGDDNPLQQALCRAEHVRKALAGISEPQREALVLAYYAGLTQQEISTLLELPLGTVKTRMRDGLLKLRSRVGSQVGSAE